VRTRSLLRKCWCCSIRATIIALTLAWCCFKNRRLQKVQQRELVAHLVARRVRRSRRALNVGAAARAQLRREAFHFTEDEEGGTHCAATRENAHHGVVAHDRGARLPLLETLERLLHATPHLYCETDAPVADRKQIIILD